MPCPIGIVPTAEPYHLSSGATMPALSPGKSMPVVLPKPKLEIQCASRFSPSSSEIVIAPMLDECGEYLRDGQALRAARLGVVDRPCRR